MFYKLKYFFLVCTATASSYASAQSADSMTLSRRLNDLEKRVERLEQKYDRLSDRLDRVEDRQSENNRRDDSDRSGEGCRRGDFVKLVEKFSINVISENLCPYQCAKLLQNQQRNNPQKTYSCIKQDARIW